MAVKKLKHSDIIFYKDAVQVTPDSDISDFEESIGYKIPSEYRDFLKYYAEATFFSSESNLSEDEEASLCFEVFGQHRKSEGIFIVSEFVSFNDSLLDTYENNVETWGYPRYMLPVAFDPGGVTLNICCHPSAYGAVFIAGDRFLEKYNSSSEKSEISFEDFDQVFSSFPNFIKALRWTVD